MKLLFCTICSNVVTLDTEVKQCDCGRTGGKYVDEVYAHYWGNPVLLGFNNTSFTKAIASSHNAAEPDANTVFEAFVFDPKCYGSHVKKMDEKELR